LTARHIDGDRLGHINMATRLHGLGGLFGMEIRRTLNYDSVRLPFQEFPVRRKAGEPTGRRHLESVAHGINAVLEVVGHGEELVTAVFLEQVGDPASAAAAAD